MPSLDDLFKKAVDQANSIFFGGVLGFGFFFVFLTASANLPEPIRLPMQIIMLVASTVSAATIVVAPFLRKKPLQDDENSSTAALPPPETGAQPSQIPTSWPDYVDRIR
jgi:hypothetical protein